MFRRATLWLAFLGPFFFATYYAANAYAASLPHVPNIAFSWEHRVPFLAWTILPYWSTDLLYAVSFYLCRTKEKLDLHAHRLFAIQIFSVLCFFAFPLRYTYAPVQLEGWEAWLFDRLYSFDKPFNQAPSLHVSLAVILWQIYKRFPGRNFYAAWLALAALSTWTTHQHHLLDLPLGAWAGLLTIAAIPLRRPGRITLIYLAGSLALLTTAFFWKLWPLLWPSFTLSLVAAAYYTGDARWLGKKNGRVPFWMWPYEFFAWLNTRLWYRSLPPHDEISPGVHLGRFPSKGERKSFAEIVDCTAELSLPGATNIPFLDLSAKEAPQIQAAVEAIDRAQRPTLICCALGVSRSATVAAHWLFQSGHAANLEDAKRRIKSIRSQVRL
jgi:hypothetical protein